MGLHELRWLGTRLLRSICGLWAAEACAGTWHSGDRAMLTHGLAVVSVT